MAFIEVTNEKNPKLAIEVNNSLNYKDKEGNLQNRQKVTALTDVVTEAGKVSDMKKGVVTLSLNTEEGYKNYFVNKDKDNNVSLKLASEPKNEAEMINFKAIKKDGEQYYYYKMENTANSEKVVNSIKIDTTEKSAYLGVRATLKNDELKEELISKNASGEKHIAIISGKEARVVAQSDLKNQEVKKETPEAKKPEAKKEIRDIPVDIKDENGKLIQKTTVKNVETKKPEDAEKKKAFKPKEKVKSKDRELER